MRNSRVDVQPIAGALGAEVHGVDVSQDLDEATVAEIRQALLDHGVIFFRDQQLDIDRHKVFTRRFGEIFIHPNYFGVSADPEIVDVKREPGDKKIVGEDWHTDTTMVAEPPMGAILYAIEVPPYGGDTLFANQYLAYETLSDGMKCTLEGLRAVHTDRLVAGPKAGMNAHRSTKVREDANWRETVSVHPVVAHTRRPAASSCSSTAPTPSASRAGPRRRAGHCSSTCSSTATGRNLLAASAGRPARSPSGTTAAPSTWRCMTRGRFAASCGAPRSAATRSIDAQPMLRIEPFLPADLPAVVAFVEAIQEHERADALELKPGREIGSAYAARLLHTVEHQDGVILMARAGRDTVGFICAWPDRDDDMLLRDDARDHGYVSDLFVLNSWRRRGVARQLPTAVESEMRRRGCRRIRIVAKAGNIAAMRCYDAAGFRGYEIVLSKLLG
jgi:ribosomal protein S18 acetylase RimI-like enzyme